MHIGKHFNVVHAEISPRAGDPGTSNASFGELRSKSGSFPCVMVISSTLKKKERKI